MKRTKKLIYSPSPATPCYQSLLTGQPYQTHHSVDTGASMDGEVVISGYRRHLGEIEEKETALAPNVIKVSPPSANDGADIGCD